MALQLIVGETSGNLALDDKGMFLVAVFWRDIILKNDAIWQAFLDLEVRRWLGSARKRLLRYAQTLIFEPYILRILCKKLLRRRLSNVREDSNACVRRFSY